jgi:hypothetical protein
VRYQASITRVAPVVLSLVHRSAEPKAVRLRCRRPVAGGTGEVFFLKTTALKTR